MDKKITAFRAEEKKKSFYCRIRRQLGLTAQFVWTRGNLSVVRSKKTSDILHFTAALKYISTLMAGCDLRAYAMLKTEHIFEFNREWTVIRRARRKESLGRTADSIKKCSSQRAQREITDWKEPFFCRDSGKLVALTLHNTLRCNLTTINATSIEALSRNHNSKALRGKTTYSANPSQSLI